MMLAVLDLLFGWVNAADWWALHALNSVSGNSIVDSTIEFVCTSQFIKGAIPLAIYWYLWFDGSRRLQTSRAVLLKGVAAALVAVLVARLIAHALPVRVRPFADPASGFRSLFSATGTADFEDWSSFPSDTAAFEFALAWSLMAISRPVAWFLLVYGGVFACLTRIYLGVHYPSDIIVGAALGIAVAALIQKLDFTRISRNRLLRGNYVHPLFYALAFLITFEFAQVFDDLRALRKIIIQYIAASSQTDMRIPLIGLGLMFAGAAVVTLAVLARLARTPPELRQRGRSGRMPPAAGPMREGSPRSPGTSA